MSSTKRQNLWMWFVDRFLGLGLKNALFRLGCIALFFNALFFPIMIFAYPLHLGPFAGPIFFPTIQTFWMRPLGLFAALIAGGFAFANYRLLSAACFLAAVTVWYAAGMFYVMLLA